MSIRLPMFMSVILIVVLIGCSHDVDPQKSVDDQITPHVLHVGVLQKIVELGTHGKMEDIHKKKSYKDVLDDYESMMNGLVLYEVSIFERWALTLCLFQESALFSIPLFP